jgi:hypothetical protein
MLTVVVRCAASAAVLNYSRDTAASGTAASLHSRTQLPARLKVCESRKRKRTLWSASTSTAKDLCDLTAEQGVVCGTADLLRALR